MDIETRNKLKQKINDIETIQKIIAKKDEFIAYLLCLQDEYRIQRGLWPDEWNQLLHYTYAIDDIIKTLDETEKELFENQTKAKNEYYEKLKEKWEKEQKEQQINSK